MKGYARLLAPVALGVALAGCSSATQIESDVRPAADSTGRRASDIRLLGAITAGDYQRNMVLSPYGLRRLFGMLVIGARGRTRDQIVETLSLTDKAGAPPPALPGLRVRDGMWIDRRYTTSPSYESAIRERFGADVTHVDFRSSNAATAIGRWVSRSTGGQVTRVPLPPNATFVAADALAYHVVWAQQFDVRDTKPGPFHAADGTVPVPMMHRVVAAQLFEDGQGRYIRLPFTDGNSMLVALPAEKLSPSTLTHAIRVIDTRSAAEDIQLTLPRFAISSHVELLNPLERVGMVAAFDRDADFSPIFGGSGLYLTSAFEQGAIAVDERGARIAVVSVAIRAQGPSRLMTFNVDRPFAFVVEDTKTHQILVAGIVARP